MTNELGRRGSLSTMCQKYPINCLFWFFVCFSFVLSLWLFFVSRSFCDLPANQLFCYAYMTFIHTVLKHPLSFWLAYFVPLVPQVFRTLKMYCGFTQRNFRFTVASFVVLLLYILLYLSIALIALRFQYKCLWSVLSAHAMHDLPFAITNTFLCCRLCVRSCLCVFVWLNGPPPRSHSCAHFMLFY